MPAVRRRTTNEPSPSRHPHAHRLASCLAAPGDRPVPFRAARPVVVATTRAMLPPTDPDQTPTEPTTDPGRRADAAAGRAAATIPGPAVAGGRAADAGRAIRRAVVAARARRDVRRRHRGRTRRARSARRRSDAPSRRHVRSRRSSTSSAQAWDTLHKEYVGRATSTTGPWPTARSRASTEAVGDTGHTSFLTPEERAARNDELSGSYVGIGVRIDATDGRPAARRSASSRTARPRRPASWPGDIIVDRRRQVDRPATDLDEVAGWIRGEAGTVGRADRPRRRRMARRATLHDRPRGRPDRVRLLDAWSRARRTALLRLDAVLARRGRRHGQGAQGDQGGRRRPAGPRPARQPGRLRQRGHRRRQPVPRRAATSTSSATPTARRRTTRSRPTGSRTDLPLVVLVDDGTASSCRDRLGRAAGRRPCPDRWASRRSAPGRSSASSRCPTGRRCGSGRSSG